LLLACPFHPTLPRKQAPPPRAHTPKPARTHATRPWVELQTLREPASQPASQRCHAMLPLQCIGRSTRLRVCEGMQGCLFVFTDRLGGGHGWHHHSGDCCVGCSTDRQTDGQTDSETDRQMRCAKVGTAGRQEGGRGGCSNDLPRWDAIDRIDTRKTHKAERERGGLDTQAHTHTDIHTDRQTRKPAS